MLIPKEMIVEKIRARGDFDGAERADEAFDEKVDTDRDADLLASFGVDADELIDDFRDQAPEAG
jgi:hypothetical protein